MVDTTSVVEEGERSPFLDLRDAKRRWWHALLDYPVMTGAVVSYAMIKAATPLDELVLFRETAFQLTQRELGHTRHLYEELLPKAVALCMDLDVDTKISSAILDDIDRMELGDEPKELDLVQRPRRGSSVFQRWCAASRIAAIQYRGIFDEIVRNNLGLVWSVVRRNSFTYEKNDVFQVGVTGMMKAIHRFNVALGFTFSTYASHWIRSEIHRYEQDTVQVVRMPNYLQDVLYRMRQIEKSYAAEGRTASNEQIRDELERRYQQTASLEKIARYREHINAGSVSMESKKGQYVMLTAADPNVPDLDEAITIQQVRAIIDRMDLRPAMRDAVEWMCGLHENETITLDLIGKEYGVTRERIRQLAAQGMKLLRHELDAPRRAKLRREVAELRSRAGVKLKSKPKRKRRPKPIQRLRPAPKLVMPTEGHCFECDAPQPQELALARMVGWYRATIKIRDDDGERDTYEEICPRCVLSEDYLTGAKFERMLDRNAHAFDSEEIDYDCSSCTEIVTQTPRNARKRGWGVRWSDEGVQIECPGCRNKRIGIPTTSPRPRVSPAPAPAPAPPIEPIPEVRVRVVPRATVDRIARTQSRSGPIRASTSPIRAPIADVRPLGRISQIPPEHRCSFCGGDGQDPLGILRGEPNAPCTRCHGSGRRLVGSEQGSGT